MGISQQIGSSSLSKPGVCTSTTRPATPYEGQMIYETDTDKVLVYNGSAWKQVPTAATAGAVLQTFSVQGATQQLSTTTTYVDCTSMTVTITPQANTNKILIISSNSLLASTASADGGIRILRGATNIFTSVQCIGTTNVGGSYTTTFLDSPATTSATTYKIQFNRDAGTGNMWHSITNTLSNLVVMEISA